MATIHKKVINKKLLHGFVKQAVSHNKYLEEKEMWEQLKLKKKHRHHHHHRHRSNSTSRKRSRRSRNENSGFFN